MRTTSAISGCRRAIRLLAFLLAWLGALAATADEVSRAEMRSLDDQVQEIKSDVLSIAAELNQLEEKLLYPSNTQVAVFVAVAEEENVLLDSVRVQIDGEIVAQHIYTLKEVAALKKGGVQRIYTGNVPTGEHALEVSVAGKRGTGGDFDVSERIEFEKRAEPALLGITLGSDDFGNAELELAGW